MLRILRTKSYSKNKKSRKKKPQWIALFSVKEKKSFALVLEREKKASTKNKKEKLKRN